LPSEEELEKLCESMKHEVLFRVQSKEPGRSPTLIFPDGLHVTSLSDDENQADCRYDAGVSPGDGEYEVTVEVNDTGVLGLGAWTTSCDVEIGIVPKGGEFRRALFRRNKFAGTDEHQGCCTTLEADDPVIFPPLCPQN
jgi:hypothetical protein